MAFSIARPLLAILATCALAAGCGNDRGFAFTGAPLAIEPPRDDASLAIEHRLTIEVAEDELEAAYQAVVQGCANDAESLCTLLESTLAYGEYGSASLRARVRPAGVEPLIAIATSHGEVIRRSTRGEDLAKPIGDAEKSIAMLEAYLADLIRLRQQSRNEIDALIRVAAEIAKTQTDLDASKSEQAQLRQRVDLQILELNFVSEQRTSFWGPIGNSLGEFTQDLAAGIATVIRGLASLLPWLVVLVPLLYLLRRLWKRFK